MKRCTSRKARAAALLVAVASLGLVGMGGPAQATGGNNTTTCSTARTICINYSANIATSCGTIPGGWQCTPIAVASAGAVQIPANTGGSLTLNGWAQCEFREKSDGLNNDWTPWQSCGPFTRSGDRSTNWGVGQNPAGASVHLQWGSIINLGTPFAQDCIEVRMRVRSQGSGRSHVAGVTLENAPFATVSFPSSGTHTDGICE